MRVIGKIGFYLVVAIAMYLTALWGWGIWLYVLAIPVGLILLAIGILLLLIMVGAIVTFFSARKTHPFIHPPRNEIEATLLLQKILNAAEDPAYANWPLFEPCSLAWAEFIWDESDASSCPRLSILVQEILDIEERFGCPNSDYDYESGPIYSTEDIRIELYGLASTWFNRASEAGQSLQDHCDYLRRDTKVTPSPARRMINWAFKFIG